MLTKIHDLTIAKYPNLESVNQKEINQADIIAILGLHPQGIYTPKYARWLADISDIKNPLEILRSKRERKRTKKTLNKIFKNGYSTEVKLLDLNAYQEFKFFFEKVLTQQKQRFIYPDIDGTLLARIKNKEPVWVIQVRDQNSQLVGVLTLRINKKNEIRVSFGAKLHLDEFRGGIGSLLEYSLVEFAIKHNITIINHGRNTNPTGLISKPGIFEFKSRWGYTAYPEGEWHTLYVINPEALLGKESVWITTLNNKIIYLIATNKYSQLTLKDAAKYKTKLINQVKLESIENIANLAKQMFRL